MRIAATEHERTSRRLTDRQIQLAVGALATDGYVILGNVIDHSALDLLRPQLSADTAEFLARGGGDAPGMTPGIFQQGMPRKAPFVSTHILNNPLIIDITAEVLGTGLRAHYYHCNTNVPGSQQQYLHRDAGHLWPNLPHPTTTINIDISLDDVDAKGGATEVWPGTHTIVEPPGELYVAPEYEAWRRRTVPPVRAEVRKGDAVLRDVRTWHRGVPNRGSSIRHMIGLMHSSWFISTEPLRMAADAIDVVSDTRMAQSCSLVPDDYDYVCEFVQLPGMEGR